MNYFEEYIEQLMSLRKGEKTKIDVHFIISEPLTSFCIDVNQKIKKYNIGFINMGVESIIVPHISLFMGFVDNYEMLEEVFRQVAVYAKTICPFTLDTTSMYFKGVSSTAPQYLFIDSLQTEFLMQQKEELDKYLKNIVFPIGWDMKKERAHVTVGCYKNLTPAIRKLADSYNAIPPCKISQIGVSISGTRGVALSLLKVFDF